MPQHYDRNNPNRGRHRRAEDDPSNRSSSLEFIGNYAASSIRDTANFVHHFLHPEERDSDIDKSELEMSRDLSPPPSVRDDSWYHVSHRRDRQSMPNGRVERTKYQPQSRTPRSQSTSARAQICRYWRVSAPEQEKVKIDEKYTPPPSCDDSESSHLRTARSDGVVQKNGEGRMTLEEGESWASVCGALSRRLDNEYEDSGTLPLGYVEATLMFEKAMEDSMMTAERWWQTYREMSKVTRLELSRQTRAGERDRFRYRS